VKFLYFFIGFVGFVVAVSTWIRYRDRKLAEERSGQGFNEFASYFSADGIPLYRLRDVYAYFQNWQSVDDFPVRPEDVISKVYGMFDEDLDDAAHELAKTWRVKFPDPDELQQMPPVRTVADLVRFLSRCRPE
jgi:hypothetical protein